MSQGLIEKCNYNDLSLYEAVFRIAQKTNEVIDLLNKINPDIPQVQSVNGKTGNVILNAADVHALPETYKPPVLSVNSKTGTITLSAADVHALPDTYKAPVLSVNGKTGEVVIETGGAVDSVNGQTGVVNLSFSDVGAASTAELQAVEALANNAQKAADNADILALQAKNAADDAQKTADSAYKPGNAPPYPVTSVNGKTGDVKVRLIWPYITLYNVGDNGIIPPFSVTEVIIYFKDGPTLTPGNSIYLEMATLSINARSTAFPLSIIAGTFYKSIGNPVLTVRIDGTASAPGKLKLMLTNIDLIDGEPIALNGYYALYLSNADSKAINIVRT